MYFLNEVEQKLLIHRLLPTSREAKISEELRGWSWHQPPLKPYFEVKIPMYMVASKYCPTGRDLYLNKVENVKPDLNFNVSLGKMIHGAVSDALLYFVSGQRMTFEVWAERIRWEGFVGDRKTLLTRAEEAWNYVIDVCEGRLAQIGAEQPYASERDLITTVAPFLVEHKISGELLGLSGQLSLDSYDFLRSIVFDLKVEGEPKDWHRLAPVGYAMVFESVHEAPIDIGCIVYVSFQKDGRLTVKKDLFFASEELRRMWVLERDEKLRMVAERKDPGLPSSCPETCIYHRYCKG